ncbi:MAG: leucine-rich repeat protein [Lentisphaeria bacterium]|nr:leucine-rich repeat protein [Lentisphaeria bacterium]
MKKTTTSFTHILLACVLLSALEIIAASVSVCFPWDNRSSTILTGTEWISPTASGENTGALMVRGEVVANWSEETPLWDTTTVSDGWYKLSLAPPESAETDVLVLNADNVVIHEGDLENDEVWQAGVTHIVRNYVKIPEGKRLVMANGAIVKFCMDTGIINNGTLSALSTTLTALEDDEIAGDTNLDSSATAPADGTYSIKHDGTLTAINCEMYYATDGSVFNTATIAEGAFSGCSELTKIEIPAEVTSIEADAFKGCSNLKEATFNGTTTDVDKTAFDDCDNLAKVNFPNSLPSKEYVFGEASPIIYSKPLPLPPTWNGYMVYSYNDNPNLPEDGEPGQVLTLTEDGIEWQDIPVDATLDSESSNAIQNKAVVNAIDELTAANGTMQEEIESIKNAVSDSNSDIEALQTSVNALESLTDSLKSTNQELKNANQELKSANQELAARLNALLVLLENSGKESQVLTKAADGSFAWKDASGSGTQVLTIKLEEGWNLVAMPGNVLFDESEAAILSEIEIYTYDRTQQIYLPSEGLEPLTSYWMHAPKACTIHFEAEDQKGK